jgi:macrolide transport system ATP-binding/permease protein
MTRLWRRRSQRLDEIDDEIRIHLEMARRDREANGASSADARSASRRELGSVALVGELTREVWGRPALERLWQDVRYAVRMRRRSPGFALVAMLSLALGIGANTAAFSMADAALLRPLPVADPARVVAIDAETPQQTLGRLSFPDFEDIARRTRAFDGLVASRTMRLALARASDPVPQVRVGLMVSRGFFQTLGVQPALGRAFTDEESTTPGRDAVVILSDELWRTQFGADPRAIGTTIRLNGQPFTIVGVAPSQFTGLSQFLHPALYAPMTALAGPSRPDGPLQDRAATLLTVRGRLATGATLARAQAEVGALARALAETYPETNRGRTFTVRTEIGARIAEAPATLAIVTLLLALAGLVLFIACANVAGLLLARARSRGREIAIRLAIGAGRVRLLRQLLTESLVLSIVGALAGMGLAWLVIRALASWRLPTDTPIGLAVQLDLRVLGFTAAASMASVLLFGLVPAWRTTSPALTDALKASEAGLAGRARQRGRHALVVAQIALCAIVLVVSGGLFDAFRRMVLVDPGVDGDRLMMMELDPELVGYTPERTRLFYEQLVARVRALPEVRAASLSAAVPFRPNFSDQEIVPEGYRFARDERSARVPLNVVDEQYFSTIDLDIVRGRAFAQADGITAPRVAIVNEVLAERYWSGQDPVGRRVRLGVDGPFAEIVGVARTGKYGSLAEAPQPYLYVPLAQQPRSRMTLMAQAHGDPRLLAAPLLQSVRALDPGQPVFNARDFRTFFDQGALGLPRVLMQMIGVAGFVGLGLALVGLYGVVAYSVSRRTREIGIRMAIGATKRDVLTLVLRQGLTLASVGALIGIGLSTPVFRLMATGLAGLGGLSYWTLVLVPLGLMAVTLGACWLPARRATRIDPTIALRVD